MKKRYNTLGSVDIADVRKAINDSLASVHPELVFKAKDIKYVNGQLYVDLRVRVTEDVAVIAKSRGLTLEKVGEYQLTDFEPGRNPRKPYVLRKTDGSEYEAGADFVEKVFKEREKTQ